MPKVRIKIKQAGQPATRAPQPQGESSSSLPGVLAGGAALIGGGYLAKKFGLGKIADYANSLRQQLMLSGLAVPKSALGNVGATAIESAERGTMAPLRELFSMDTVRDIKNLYKQGGQVQAGVDAATNLPGPTPGRIMGTIDQATRNAMQRAGLTAKEAEKAVFQTPLGENYGKFGGAMDSPAARYLIPFRRTPFNQLYEGLQTIKPANAAAHPYVLGGTMAAGALHGAATAEDRFPVSVGLGAAATAKYGLPYSLAALAGRTIAGGRGGGGVAATAIPISEYGIESGINDPLAPFTDPAALKALRRMSGGK